MNTYQMLNRDTGVIVYQAEASGWRQFKIAYAKWAQTNERGMLAGALQLVRRPPEDTDIALTVFTADELRVIGRILSARQGSQVERICRKIRRHLMHGL